jgi:hypothetical protein
MLKAIYILVLSAGQTLAQLQVVSPFSLKTLFFPPGHIESKVGSFGYQEKDSSQFGTVYEPIVNKDGCVKFEWTDFNRTLGKNEKTWFVIVKRGGCSFPAKIQNAQQFGASVLIVQDYSATEKQDQSI